MRIIAFLTAAVIFTLTLCGCGDKFNPSKANTLDISKLTADLEYTTGSEDKLYSYYEKSDEDFLGACKYYEEKGYKLYNHHQMGDNKFATYIKGKEMAHLYWIACEEELNVIISKTNGQFLPNNIKSIKGNKKITVTQLKSDVLNGMGYVITLADGSFVIIDGGWDSVADELFDTLVKLNGGEKGIVIRSWIMTHSHNDHYSCFMAFADKYADKVKLECFMLSPLSVLLQEGKDTYLNIEYKKDLAKFAGAKSCFVYTGMLFEFGDVKAEILLTPDEVYNTYISDNFNDASIVSRFYTDKCKALFLADAGDIPAYMLMTYYGEYLKSDICQVSHHGVEDCPLAIYKYIKAPHLFFPCDTQLYTSNRAETVRKGLINSKYTEKTYVHSVERYTLEFKKYK